MRLLPIGNDLWRVAAWERGKGMQRSLIPATKTKGDQREEDEHREREIPAKGCHPRPRFWKFHPSIVTQFYEERNNHRSDPLSQKSACHAILPP